jgi:hypothetical protein
MEQDHRQALTRRVPGAARTAPTRAPRRIWSAAELERIRAAVQASQRAKQSSDKPEPDDATEPLPRVLAQSERAPGPDELGPPGSPDTEAESLPRVATASVDSAMRSQAGTEEAVRSVGPARPKGQPDGR